MNVCIPLQKDLEEYVAYNQVKLASHFGTANTFIVFNTDTQEVLGKCRLLKQCSGSCKCPIPDTSDYDIDAFIGPAMGFRLAQMARRNSKKVYVTPAQTLQEVLEQLSHKDFLPMTVPRGKCFARLY